MSEHAIRSDTLWRVEEIIKNRVERLRTKGSEKWPESFELEGALAEIRVHFFTEFGIAVANLSPADLPISSPERTK